MRILFMSDLLTFYEEDLKRSLFELGLPAFTFSDVVAEKVDEVEFIIYSPVQASDGTTIERDFSSYKNLRAVLSLYAGVECLTKSPTLNCPVVKMVDEGLTSGMVEWCVAHTLRIHLGIDRHILGQDGTWRKNIKPLLARYRKVGILGLGSLGQPTASALNLLGFEVHGWSRSEKELDNISCYHGDDGLKKILAMSEILIILLPLTKETFHIINYKTLSYMPKSAAIINAGRGGLINDKALLESLKAGHLAHATLDVFNEEPLPPTHPYWLNPKVTVTPHIAADTVVETSSRSIAKNIQLIIQGDTPLGLVNTVRGY
jgi:glyoxylate/hydroxypyruvate reductase A